VLVPTSYSPLFERAEEAPSDQVSESADVATTNAQLDDAFQRSNLAKSEFVAFVAHELKNPMTSIKGYAELLASGALGEVNEMQANFLSTIRANVERMSNLVSDLNDSAKIEANRLRLDYKQVQIPDILDEVLSAANRLVESKGQILELHLPAQLPLAWADSYRLSQILTKLVNNAHKYTPEGGVILIGAEVTANEWDPRGAPQVIHFWVQDNGIGISIEDQVRIFQKHFRSEDSRVREVAGSGLGLHLARSLVEMMGGRIWFESEVRKGSTFHFTIPVVEG
jgi:signal transduction histidine kinase